MHAEFDWSKEGWISKENVIKHLLLSNLIRNCKIDTNITLRKKNTLTLPKMNYNVNSMTVVWVLFLRYLACGFTPSTYFCLVRSSTYFLRDAYASTIFLSFHRPAKIEGESNMRESGSGCTHHCAPHRGPELGTVYGAEGGWLRTGVGTVCGAEGGWLRTGIGDCLRCWRRVATDRNWGLFTVLKAAGYGPELGPFAVLKAGGYGPELGTVYGAEGGWLRTGFGDCLWCWRRMATDRPHYSPDLEPSDFPVFGPQEELGWQATCKLSPLAPATCSDLFYTGLQVLTPRETND